MNQLFKLSEAILRAQSRGISAEIIADSINPNGKRIVTFVTKSPRIVHAQTMTHRLFSRNAASSRAIPVPTNVDYIEREDMLPIYWGKNRAGMKAVEECDELIYFDGEYLDRETAWRKLRRYSCDAAIAFSKAGYHKQITNRFLEPFSNIKVVITATEYDNFFNLRRHKDTQPELRVLADIMYELYKTSVPRQLDYGDWHLPYITDEMREQYDVKILRKISASCCAQVSYRTLDTGVDKALRIFKQLVQLRPVHASPFEHQATPIPQTVGDNKFVPGVTHMDRNGDLWSANFRDWIQFRQLISEHTCWNYREKN